MITVKDLLRPEIFVLLLMQESLLSKDKRAALKAARNENYYGKRIK